MHDEHVNDVTDTHHSDNCGRDTKLSTTDNSLGLIKSKDRALIGSMQDGSNIAYDPGSVNFSSNNITSGLLCDSGSHLNCHSRDRRTCSNTRHSNDRGAANNSDHSSVDNNIVYDPGGFSIIDDHKHMHNTGNDRFNNSIKINSAHNDDESGGDTNDQNLVYDPGGGIHFNNGLGSNLEHNSIKSNASTNNSFCATNASHTNGCSATHSHFYAMCHIDPLRTRANHTSYTQRCPTVTAYNQQPLHPMRLHTHFTISQCTES